jgi:tetratricopeptide (TPR) repeat protein
MSAEDRIGRASELCLEAVSSGDLTVLAEAERCLDAVEADVALTRGRVLHVRYQRSDADSPAEDPAELALFQRAEELYRSLGDVRGQGEALFWIGCVHQFIRGDDQTAVPYLERSSRLAAEAGDASTQAEALRHLGIAAHGAGRLDEARRSLEESSRLWSGVGRMSGVAANMIGLAFIAAAQGRRTDAVATLDEAEALAQAHGAHAVLRDIEQVRTQI